MIKVLICGPQGAGKTTLARNLLVGVSNSHHLKFAAVLYELHGLIINHLNKLKINIDKHGKPFEGIDGPLLQVLGSEWARKTRGEDYWVKVMQQRVSDLKKQYPATRFVFIDDCRFENELFAFDAASTFKIKLVASEEVRKARAEKWRENTSHASEIGLDHIPNEEYNLVLDAEAMNEVALFHAAMDALLAFEKKCAEPIAVAP